MWQVFSDRMALSLPQVQPEVQPGAASPPTGSGSESRAIKNGSTQVVP